MKLAKDGPGTIPSRDMVKATNSIYPYASALTVLDLGCGVGELTDAVIESHGSELPPSSRLVASDIAAGMIGQLKIRKANAIAEGATAWSKVEPSVDDSQDLSAFSDGSVSHLLAGFVIFMVPEPRTALKEIRRVLTDENGGGVFAMSTWLGQAVEWFQIVALTNQFRPGRPSTKMPQQWLTIDGVRSELEEAGFRDVDVHPVKSYLPFESYEQLADFMINSFPKMDKLTADFTEEELAELRRQIIDYAKSRHPTVPSKLEGTAIVAVCRK
jgi:ubiquinone/menaquinone biosynthesis C-methylase UbiE